jgi:hypothetical protein
MITITINNEETGAYIDGYLEFDPKGGLGAIESFITGKDLGITIDCKYGFFGEVKVFCADTGNRNNEGE